MQACYTYIETKHTGRPVSCRRAVSYITKLVTVCESQFIRIRDSMTETLRYTDITYPRKVCSPFDLPISNNSRVAEGILCASF